MVLEQSRLMNICHRKTELQNSHYIPDITVRPWCEAADREILLYWISVIPSMFLLMMAAPCCHRPQPRLKSDAHAVSSWTRRSIAGKSSSMPTAIKPKHSLGLSLSRIPVLSGSPTIRLSKCTRLLRFTMPRLLLTMMFRHATLELLLIGSMTIIGSMIAGSRHASKFWTDVCVRNMKPGLEIAILHNRSLDLCRRGWYGVKCDRYGDIDAVELPYNQVTGRLPPELSLLDTMHCLDLTGNFFLNEGEADLWWLGDFENMSELLIQMYFIFRSVNRLAHTFEKQRSCTLVKTTLNIMESRCPSID